MNCHRLMLFLAATLLFASEPAQAEKPNVIVIMADDLGYGDVSCYGATALGTPHIDQLASERLKQQLAGIIQNGRSRP